MPFYFFSFFFHWLNLGGLCQGEIQDYTMPGICTNSEPYYRSHTNFSKSSNYFLPVTPPLKSSICFADFIVKIIWVKLGYIFYIILINLINLGVNFKMFLLCISLALLAFCFLKTFAFGSLHTIGKFFWFSIYHAS